jgi:YVTN family beta-propeller protein
MVSRFALVVVGAVLFGMWACADTGAATLAAARGTALPAAVWVQDPGSNAVSGITAADRVRRVTVCQDPFAIGIVPDGRTVYVSCLTSVVPLSTKSRRVGKPIKVKGGPGQMTITPDGRTVYVVGGPGGNMIVPISATSNRPGRPIRVAGPRNGPEDLAVNPNGKTVYTLDQDSVVPVITRTGTAGKAILKGTDPRSMVFGPNGKTGYVLASPNEVFPVDTTTGKAGRPIFTGSGQADSWAMAILPDGRAIYVTNYGTGTVVPISTATRKAGKALHVGYEPTSIAITPNGKTVYVATVDGVFPISTATNKVGKPIRIKNFTPNAIAISADGGTAWVSGVGPTPGIAHLSPAPGYVLPITVASNRPGKLIKTGKHSNSNCLVVMPSPSARGETTLACNP